MSAQQSLIVDGPVLIQFRQRKGHGLRVLLSRAGVENDDFIIRPDLAAVAKFFQAIETDSGLRADTDAFETNATAHPRDDAFLTAGDGAAAAGADGVEHHEI